MISRFFLFMFLAASLTDLSALFFDWRLVHMGFKSLLIPTLAGYYLVTTKNSSFVFPLALFFCWLGDVFLLGSGELFFMLGLASFLVGHVLYVVSYRAFRSGDITQGLMVTQKIRFSLPVVLIGTGLIVVLFPTLGPLKIPVLIYATVLMLMVMSAIFRFGRTPAVSFWLIIAGAALFMLSDSLLAINKFHTPFEYSGLMVMATYILAQYLIVAGALRHDAEKS